MQSVQKSMLSETLNTNEVKNAAGTEQEFRILSRGEGRKAEWALITEAPAYKHRILISNQETGTGLREVRRSMLRVDKEFLSSVDSVSKGTVSAYQVLIIPTGLMTTSAEAANVLAELGSLTFTLASSTFLYDGTGNGAAALLGGTC